MDISIWIILIVSVLFVIGLVTKKSERKEPYVYSVNSELLSPAERSFFGTLNQVVDESTLVFAKVRVADILRPQKGMSRSNWQRAFNRISSKHFDFVLCSSNTVSVLCVIELNDKSHSSNRRKSRDKFLREACASASLLLIEIPVKRSYVIEEVRRELTQALEKEEKGSE